MMAEGRARKYAAREELIFGALHTGIYRAIGYARPAS